MKPSITSTTPKRDCLPRPSERHPMKPGSAPARYQSFEAFWLYLLCVRWTLTKEDTRQSHQSLISQIWGIKPELLKGHDKTKSLYQPMSNLMKILITLTGGRHQITYKLFFDAINKAESNKSDDINENDIDPHIKEPINKRPQIKNVDNKHRNIPNIHNLDGLNDSYKTAPATPARTIIPPTPRAPRRSTWHTKPVDYWQFAGIQPKSRIARIGFGSQAAKIIPKEVSTVRALKLFTSCSSNDIECSQRTGSRQMEWGLSNLGRVTSGKRHKGFPWSSGIFM